MPERLPWQRLEQLAELQGPATAIVCGDASYTFSRLNERAKGLAAWLTKTHGLNKGDRLVWLGLNHIEIIPLFFACTRIGAVFTPFNSRLALAEYCYLVENAEPSLIIHDQNFEETAKALDFSGSILSVNDLCEEREITGVGSARNTALLVYTSGTTGRPKGVELTQLAVLANIENCNAVYDFQPDDTVLVTLPLFHVGGLCILLLPALLSGAKIVLHERFSPLETLRSIEQDRVSVTILVPAQMAAMQGLPQWTTTDLSSLRVLAVGSSIIPLGQIQRFHERGIPVSQVYGATETGPAAICLKISDCKSHEGSAGTAAKLCEIRVVDQRGADCAEGETGEILVKGPNVMSGYWRNEDATRDVFVEGYYRTGDLGYRDQDGFFTIVDRLRDMIISGGENIYPAEVEAVSLTHPAIAAIAIVGKPDPHWGETPVAYAELIDGAELDLSGYIEFLNERLARYKHPSTLIIRNPLPRNSMGKIEKAVLREEAKGLGG